MKNCVGILVEIVLTSPYEFEKRVPKERVFIDEEIDELFSERRV